MNTTGQRIQFDWLPYATNFISSNLAINSAQIAQQGKPSLIPLVINTSTFLKNWGNSS